MSKGKSERSKIRKIMKSQLARMKPSKLNKVKRMFKKNPPCKKRPQPDLAKTTLGDQWPDD